MKGILKIYHPDETLKYFIVNSYCKAIFSNNETHLEVEVGTSDDLDHVEDDSLQYNFPQIALAITDFPLKNKKLEGQTVTVPDDGEDYTVVNLFDDEEAEIYENQLCFTKNEEGILQVVWSGKIQDFYTGSEELIPFKLKCHFKEEIIDIEE
ncbi:hypothetical protein [Riemerella columbipharyngis]|uniref:Uncharacterized protein n=1 Tax=Riemerella columbipharyngis TaxID=1071918 RepID=A0A1G7AAX0_9FLAO|nr:hypothetical protein [Riemerella columbipharyngis]SDE12098.1 hypothetical protein SAMN05421544_103113 [Riemerella columbipharyngis]